MQPKMAKYDSTVVLRKSPYNYISKLENKHMAYMSIDSNAKNIANGTDPELKGRWTEPPAAKRRFFGELE